MVKNLSANAGDMGSIPGSGGCPGEGNDNTHQHSCLRNPMARGALWATVHGVTKSQPLNTHTHTHTHTHTANKGIHEWRWKGKGTVILGRPKRESTYTVLTSVFKALNQLASLLFRITDLKTSLSLFFRKGHQSPQSFFDSEAGGFLLYCAIEAEEEKQYIVK